MLDIQGQDRSTKSSYTVTLSGRLDSRTAREFQLFQEELIRTGRYFLVLDARALQYVSSSGIAALLALVRRLQGRGAAALLAPNQEVRLLLEFFAITDYLPVFSTEAEAQSYLSDRAAALGPELAVESGEAQPLPEARAKEGAPKPTGPPFQEAGLLSRPPLEVKEIPQYRPVRARPIESRDVQTPAEGVSTGGVSMAELRDSIREDLRRIVKEELGPVLATAGTGGGAGGKSAPGPELQTRKAMLARPEVIRCEQCGGKFRVRIAGRHQCPHCRVELQVSPEGQVDFTGPSQIENS